MGQPRPLFRLFLLFSNTRLQWGSNSDRWRRRQACWPLDHHHEGIFFDKKITVGSNHSSVDLSATFILRSRVRAPSLTYSRILIYIVDAIFVCGMWKERKLTKNPGFGLIKIKFYYWAVSGIFLVHQLREALYWNRIKKIVATFALENSH